MLFDTGANVNIITTKGIQKLNNIKIKECEELETITIADGTTLSTEIYVNLKISVNNNLSIKERFFIIDYDNPYFDIILGRSIQKKYRLYIDPDDDSLYQKTKKGPKHITQVCTNTSNNAPLRNTLVIEKNENKEFIDTLEEICNSVPSEVREKFGGLIKKYRNCMATSLTQLTTANLEPHTISTTTDIPIKLKPYKLSKEHSDVLKQEIISLLEKGLITPSHSPCLFHY